MSRFHRDSKLVAKWDGKFVQFVADFCTEQNPSAPIECGKTAESVSAVKSHRPITGLGSTLFQK